ncbi:MAG: histidinol-phosphate transaminase [Anaerolineales bacterium]
MKSVKDYIVPWVRDSETYSDRHMDFAWAHPEILRLMSNENLIAPSQAVLDAVLEAARLGNLYPGSAEDLRSALAQKAGVSPEQVVLGNGSTDVINFTVSTFVAPGEEVIIPVPTFSMYEARVRIHGGTPVLVPLTPSPHFYWDIDAIFNAVTPNTKLIVICTPNNPTGNQIEERDLLRILDLKIPVFIDEAYYELVAEPRSLVHLIADHPHAMVSRTMSKAFGLAGFRVGYIFASPEIASYLNRVRYPWNVSLVAIAAALAALDDEADQQAKRKNTLDGRAYLVSEINKIPGLRAYPSQGNFVLIDASILNKSSEQIRDEIIAQGIFIRPMSTHLMKEGYIRVTIGTPEQNQRFIETFKHYVFENLGI